MNYKIGNIKAILFFAFLFIGSTLFAQDRIYDNDFDTKIHEKSPFDDEGHSIIVVEVWAEFNKDNAFKDWSKLKGITHYYRCDIATSPAIKKKYRIRMAPTIMVFSDGVLWESFKAGLDLECPVDLEELQETIDEAKKANQF
jgi:hypothetical protein